MVQCPECNKEQDADFGMVTCTSCGAVFMVELDGSVNQPEAIEHSEESFAPQEESADNSILGSDEIEPPMEAAESTYDENFLEPLSESTALEDVKPIATEESLSDAEDPLGLQGFDKSGGAKLADGEYLYDILIAGIDSGEIKKELLLALSDKRFSLMMDELRTKVRDGQLLIEGLNPVRAMLIVLKIQEMDVQIEWRQKHFTQGSTGRMPEVES